MSEILNIPNVCSVLYHTTLSQVKPRFKHLGFSNESEYRLVFEEGQAEETAKYLDSIDNLKRLSEKIKNVINKLNLEMEKRKHAIIGKSIRSYYALNLDPIWGGDALIPEIILGQDAIKIKEN